MSDTKELSCYALDTLAEEMYRIVSLDFKDELGYKIEIEGFKDMSAVQKWFIYDKYAKSDADIVIKSNKLMANVLGWDVAYLDAIFPVRQIMNNLLKTLGQEIDYDDIITGKKEVYDIIDGKALTEKLHEAGVENHVRSWHKVFKGELEKLCKNAHTVGNFMPCPDNNYNSVKGWKGQWHYNDRIDLLYSDILEPRCKIMSQEQRENWKAWLDKNKENFFLTEILGEKTRSELGKFGCIKKATFSADELKELPDYLKKVNELIENRSEKIKTKCTEAVYNTYFECYKNTLSEFEHGKVFMQVCSFSKGYIWVAPECEKKFEDSEIGKLFNLEIGKYFNKKPIDKVVGEASWENFFEYAYLPLYNCCIDDELSAEKNWGLDYLKDRAAYFAFKEHNLVKDYRPRYDSEVDAAPDSVTVLKNIWSWKKQGDGTLVITNYKGTSTDIVVPSMIGMSIVTAIGEKAFSPIASKLTEDQKELRSTISKVALPESIVEIGKDAFRYCEKLTEIIIPSSVKLIGDRAFFGCYALRSVKLPEGIDEIPHMMFQYCASLKSVTLPATIQKIGTMAFYECGSLEEIVIPEGTVRIGARAFEDCSTLKTVVIPASVKSVGRKMETECHIFCGSYNVTVIVEPGSCAEEYCKQNCISFKYGKNADVAAAHQSNI